MAPHFYPPVSLHSQNGYLPFLSLNLSSLGVESRGIAYISLQAPTPPVTIPRAAKKLNSKWEGIFKRGCIYRCVSWRGRGGRVIGYNVHKVHTHIHTYLNSSHWDLLEFKFGRSGWMTMELSNTVILEYQPTPLPPLTPLYVLSPLAPPPPSTLSPFTSPESPYFHQKRIYVKKNTGTHPVPYVPLYWTYICM
jgi:hypothetical protein